NRVGEEGKGWTYGKYLLEFERGAGIASAKLREALRTISDLAESDVTGRAIDDPDIAMRMSEVEVDIDALEMTELRVLSALQTGQNPGAVSSILKLRNSEIRQAVTRLGVDVIGHDGLAVEPVRPLYRLNHEPPVPEEMLTVVPEFLNGRAYTIFGGSSQIQREIIAKMVLGISAPAPRASRIACQILAGVSGVLSCLIPSSDSASITPLVMQGGPPMAPDSPQPLAPSGLVLHGAEGSSVTSIGGMSSARGRQ